MPRFAEELENVQKIVESMLVIVAPALLRKTQAQTKTPWP